jgi:hypothetical protein
MNTNVVFEDWTHEANIRLIAENNINMNAHGSSRCDIIAGMPQFRRFTETAIETQLLALNSRLGGLVKSAESVGNDEQMERGNTSGPNGDVLATTDEILREFPLCEDIPCPNDGDDGAFDERWEFPSCEEDTMPEVNYVNRNFGRDAEPICLDYSGTVTAITCQIRLEYKVQSAVRLLQ